MAEESTQFHESEDLLSEMTRDRHRAIISLVEELQAIDWYDQRIEASHDGELATILAHNRDDEKEHASMLLEWLRRKDSSWDDNLRRYLFSEAPITELED